MKKTYYFIKLPFKNETDFLILRVKIVQNYIALIAILTQHLISIFISMPNELVFKEIYKLFLN